MDAVEGGALTARLAVAEGVIDSPVDDWIQWGRLGTGIGRTRTQMANTQLIKLGAPEESNNSFLVLVDGTGRVIPLRFSFFPHAKKKLFTLYVYKINHLLRAGGFPFQCMVSNLLHWSSVSRKNNSNWNSIINALLQTIHTWF
jgi:hypothetical protein